MLLRKQVKEGTENRGAIDSVVRLVRKTVRQLFGMRRRVMFTVMRYFSLASDEGATSATRSKVTT